MVGKNNESWSPRILIYKIKYLSNMVSPKPSINSSIISLPPKFSRKYISCRSSNIQVVCGTPPPKLIFLLTTTSYSYQLGPTTTNDFWPIRLQCISNARARKKWMQTILCQRAYFFRDNQIIQKILVPIPIMATFKRSIFYPLWSIKYNTSLFVTVKDCFVQGWSEIFKPILGSAIVWQLNHVNK